jgi:pimeloyl-ACP methyl ester carboxylesterase
VPQLITDQGMVHYEVHGAGPPVILIHGWLGSWDTWRSTIEAFAGHYRMYAPDLWGFGESDKKRRERFEVTDFINLIPQFMDGLGIAKAPIIGHSMGGTTALGVALSHPEYVRKVAVVGSPINGKSLSLLLKLAGRRFIARVVLAGGEDIPLFSLGMRLYSPFVSRQQPKMFYQMTVANTARLTLSSFFSSIESLRLTDLTPRLHEVKIPAMGIYGGQDVIVNPNQHKVFQRHIPHGKTVYIRNAGHFVMMDTPEPFNKALSEFLAS